MYKRVYVWEVPMRLTHWVNVFAIALLAFTGLYIGSPFLYAPPGEVFLMATMRFIHFVAAYVFTVSWLVRLYWSFAGNQYSRIDQYFPFRLERRREMAENMKFYLFLRSHPPEGSGGHTALGGITYLVVFIFFLAEIITGFCLYAPTHYGFFWTFMGGWLLAFLASPTVRLIHHGIAWVLIVFAGVHIYLAWLNDIAEKNFVMSSIFSGYKGLDEH